MALLIERGTGGRGESGKISRTILCTVSPFHRFTVSRRLYYSSSFALCAEVMRLCLITSWPLGEGEGFFLGVVGPIAHCLVNEGRQPFTKLPEPDLQKVDLTKLIGDVLLVCSGFNNYHEVKVEESLPDAIIAITDSNLLSQVLINLIKNALENLGENRAFENPVIQIKVIETMNRIKIEICNNGEGIPPELREQIFVPFFTTKENGTGIGLSLSKQIMLKLGGDIILQTDSRNFTCFTVSLPH